MIEEFTITAFSENHIGLLNRITIIFTRRNVNIESLTVSESSIKGIHKFTIVVKTTKDKVEKVVKQIEPEESLTLNFMTKIILKLQCANGNLRCLSIVQIGVISGYTHQKYNTSLFPTDITL